jgi:hypothetical protein
MWMIQGCEELRLALEPHQPSLFVSDLVIGG